jgi:hypothetical protein
LKNASVFLPVVQRAIPEIPGAATPRNQSGTYSFDVGREIRSMLTSGAGSCTLALGHLDYLHQPAYPGYSELSSSERAAIRSSPVESIQDFSLDWQFPVIPGDRLNLYQWKIRRLQRILERQTEQTGFLEPSKRNRLIVFSDHGNRRGLTPENFGKFRYHNVVFATFGVPSRSAAEPVSLLDIPELIGLPDATRPGPADPVVEYAQVAEGDWISVMNSARLQPNGEILLDAGVTDKIGARLRGYRPYETRPDYFPTPVFLKANAS